MASSADSPPRLALPARLMALPALSESCDLAAHLYSKSKEYRMVGAVMGVAEGTLRTAVTVVAPLAAPILDRMVFLNPLDEWACGRLDALEKLAPCITKPTGEVLHAARDGVLRTVAGGDGSAPPTLREAFSSLASRTLVHVESTKGGQTAASVAHQMLDGAHSLVDRYLPEGEGDLQDTDGRDAGLTAKATALATKTSHRLGHTAHTCLLPACHKDPTLTHLVECVHLTGRNWLESYGTESQVRYVLLLFVTPMRLTVYVVVHILTVLVAIPQLLAQRLSQQRLSRENGTMMQQSPLSDHAPEPSSSSPTGVASYH